MAALVISTVIPAPIEEVYERITGFGRDGPVDDQSFQEKYGTLTERHGSTIVVQEDARVNPEDEPDLVSWRCTFDYPTSRTMEALDSTWAHRRDTFRSVGSGTRWSVRWDTQLGGLLGIAQNLVFRLVGHRRIRKQTFGPVRQHFEEQRTSEGGGR